MEEHQEDWSGVAGSVPEFGAIFMSNTATKRECLKRNVFGLPLAQANFVKQVKAGMILFLFEFEKRQLFGVFRAVSDGEINTMSSAFKSSGKQFPAQVCFTPVWHCRPLSEYEFREAIRDNYYSGKKFKFGLSEDQVRRLLDLFSTRKLKNEVPDRQYTRVRKTFVKERRQIDHARSLIGARAGLQPDMHDCAGAAFLTEYGRNSSEKFERVDGELSSRGDARENKNKIDCDQGDNFRGPNIDYDSGLISTEHENCKLLQPDLRHLVDNFSVKNEYDFSNGLDSSFTKEQLGVHPRKRASSGSFFMNNSYSLGSVMSTEHTEESLFMGSRATDDGRFRMNENAERYNLVQDNQVGDDDIRFGKSNRVDNGYALSHSKQNTSTYTGNTISETELSNVLGRPWNSSGFLCSDDPCIPHLYDSTSHDAIATRAAPYDPEVPHLFRGYSSSIAAGRGSSPDLDQHFPQSLMGNLCSSFMSESLPYQLEARGPRRYFDVDAGYGDATSYPGHHKDSYGTMNTSELDGYSKSGDFKTPAEHGFSDLFFPDPSVSFTRSKAETSEADSKSPISTSYFSNMKGEHHAGSQGKYRYNGGEGIIGEGLPSSDMGCSRLQNEASDSEARLIPRRKDSVDYDDKFRSSYTNNKRVSVFARLASAPDIRVQDEQHDIDALGNKYDMDASVDELMGLLHHSLGCQAKKMRKDKLNVKPQDDNGIANFKKNNLNTREREYGQSELNTELAASQTIENTGGSILEETRHVDFKRRSKAKKTLNASYKENSAGIMECKQSAEENAESERSAGKELAGNAKVDGSTVSLCKRRKLVRPVFGQKESDEGTGWSCGISANSQPASLENSLKEQALTLQKARKSSECIEISSSQVSSSANNKNNIIEAEKGSDLEEKRNSLSPASFADDGHGNHQPQDEGNPIITAQEPNNDGSNLCGWIEC